MDNSPSLDLSKVISVITENPDIIAQISALAKKDGRQEDKGTDTPSLEPSKSDEQTSSASSLTPKADLEIPLTRDTKNRQRLLSAFKPYLSENRARAIDSMVTIADVLHSFGGIK